MYDPVEGVFTEVGNMTAPREGHTATLLKSGDVLFAGGAATENAGYGPTASAELYHPLLPSSPPSLFSLTGDGKGQGIVWHPATRQLASPQAPAAAGEFLSMCVNGLAEGGAIPPQFAVGGRLAEIQFFGHAPGYSGYWQVNVRVPNGGTPGPAVSVRLMYLSRLNNAVTIATH